MLSKASPVLPAKDIGRAKEFYTIKLGFAVVYENHDSVAFQLMDGSMLAVQLNEGGRSDATVAGFIVSDLKIEMQALREKGVVFEDYDEPTLQTIDGVWERDGMRLTCFKDSEGNVLTIGQMQ
jgi:catechol 2,3-dioxygenase-like lactoylglutathione lyase family enzyme